MAGAVVPVGDTTGADDDAAQAAVADAETIARVR
jgi:hypothetical protein